MHSRALWTAVFLAELIRGCTPTVAGDKQFCRTTQYSHRLIPGQDQLHISACKVSVMFLGKSMRPRLQFRLAPVRQAVRPGAPEISCDPAIMRTYRRKRGAASHSFWWVETNDMFSYAAPYKAKVVTPDSRGKSAMYRGPGLITCRTKAI